MNDTSTGAGQTPLFFGARWRRSSTAIGWTLGLLGISYLLWQAFLHASAITTSGYRPDWLLLPEIVLIMAGQSIVATTIYGCLRFMNGQAALAQVLRVYFVSQAAKYLPGGGLLNLTAQTIGLSQKGQSSPSQSVIVTILTMAALCAGGLDHC